MKILICHYGILDRGGFARNFNIAKGLVSLGNKVVIISASNNIKLTRFLFKKYIRDGVEILVFWDFIPQNLLKGGFGVFSIFMKIIYSLLNKFDVAQSDTSQRPASGLPCLINKFFYKSIYVTEWWDYYGKGGHYDKKKLILKITLGNYDNLLEVPARKIADGVICISQFLFQRALASNIPKEKLTIIHGGSDIRDIVFIQNSEAKKYFNLDNNVITFGIISMADDEIEDVKEFFIVLSKIIKSNNKLKCILFGNKLNKKIKQDFKLDEILIEIGWIDFRKESYLLSAIDYFILFRDENLINKAGWPNKTGDCLAAGRPIITNAFGDLSEYVKNYPEAFIKCDKNEKEIEKIISQTIENYEFYYSLRPKIRQIAEKHFSWDLKAIEYTKFFEMTLKNVKKN